MSGHHRPQSYGGGGGGYGGSKRSYGGPSGGGGGGDPHYYDSDRKRPRGDFGGSHSFKEYASTSSGGGGGGSSGGFKTYYEGGTGRSSGGIPSLKSAIGTSSFGGGGSSRRDFAQPPASRGSSSKYMADLRGNSKQSIRRIPPPPPPLLSTNTFRSSSRGSRDTGSGNYGSGSRMRQAPPEYHGRSGFDERRPRAKPRGGGSGGSFNRPPPAGYTNRVTGLTSGRISRKPISSYRGNGGGGRSSGRNLDEIRRQTERTADVVSSRIRERAAAQKHDDKKRSSSGSRHKDSTPSKRSESKEPAGGVKKEIKEEREMTLPGDLEDMDVDNLEVLDEAVGDELEGDKVIKKEEDTAADEIQDEEKKEDDKKSEKGEEKEGSKSRSESRSRDKARSSRASKDSKEAEDKDSKALLKLHCIYCDKKCISFREFTLHLRSFAHNRSMNVAVSDMRKKLSGLRNEQRDEQRKLEKEAGDTLSDTTSYCRVCELNFRTDPKEHEANELHNKIKTMIYKKCEICDIDFRIWKVYIYHLAALEHAKKVAMKDLETGEGDNVKGTNLTQDELGFDLVVEKLMLNCEACVRYIPIKGSKEETLQAHCMTLAHIKNVDEYREKEKRYAARKKAEEERRIEREKRLKEKEEEEAKKKKEQEEKELAEKEKQEQGETSKGEGEANDTAEGRGELDFLETEENNEEKMAEDAESKGESNQEPDDEVGDEEVLDEEGEGDGEEADEDEIELHAENDEGVEEDEEPIGEAWKRTTRSSVRSSARLAKK